MTKTGTVKFFNPTKGFGFIRPQDGSDDVFVHISAVKRAGIDTLASNQRLSYELDRGPNGKVSAVNLKLQQPILRLASERPRARPFGAPQQQRRSYAGASADSAFEDAPMRRRSARY